MNFTLVQLSFWVKHPLFLLFGFFYSCWSLVKSSVFLSIQEGCNKEIMVECTGLHSKPVVEDAKRASAYLGDEQIAWTIYLAHNPVFLKLLICGGHFFPLHLTLMAHFTCWSWPGSSPWACSCHVGQAQQRANDTIFDSTLVCHSTLFGNIYPTHF